MRPGARAAPLPPPALRCLFDVLQVALALVEAALLLLVQCRRGRGADGAASGAVEGGHFWAAAGRAVRQCRGRGR